MERIYMKREEFIKAVSSKLKLIRTEYGITQEAMSEMLGISKKTLVETEKGRRDLSWTEVIAVASVFEQSEVLQGIMGGDAGDVIHALAFEDRHIKYPPTMGGKVWWRVIDEKDGIRLQQNYVTGHYRLLDKDDCSSAGKKWKNTGILWGGNNHGISSFDGYVPGAANCIRILSDQCDKAHHKIQKESGRQDQSGSIQHHYRRGIYLSNCRGITDNLVRPRHCTYVSLRQK